MNLNNNEQKSFFWYYFYNFIVIPLLIIMNISIITGTIALNADFMTITVLVIFVTIIVLKVLLFFSMILKKYFTLKLIKLSIYLECGTYIIMYITNIYIQVVLQTYNRMFIDILIILTALAWMLLNVSYFEDRREIFKN